MVIDKTNIQGNIWPGLPKNYESYYFFGIPKDKERDFGKALKSLVTNNEITTAQKALDERKKVADHKANGGTELLDIVGVNISFCPRGLRKIGKKGNTEPDSDQAPICGSDEFNWGMYKERDANGQDDFTKWCPKFVNPGDPFAQHLDENREYDGMLLVTGYCKERVIKKVTELEGKFGDSIKPIIQIDGSVRPGDRRGREHFDFKDNLSQPSLEGLDIPPTGKAPKTVPAHRIFVDPSRDGRKFPEWARDGSFLAFRKLQELVPEFDQFMATKGPEFFPHLPAAEAAELLGARLMGRWKSGAPVDVAVDKDDPNMSVDKINDFDYGVSATGQVRCPFAAHTRKMRPRVDDKVKDTHAIIRRGITYGSEVTPEERAAHKTDPEKGDRGILFVCYQSDLFNGFRTLQSKWANVVHFPPAKEKITGPGGPGLDPIIGQNKRTKVPFDISMANGLRDDRRVPLEPWVIPHGGDYLFVPSIKELWNVPVEEDHKNL